MTGEISEAVGAGVNVEDNAVDCDDLFVDEFGIDVKFGCGKVGVSV